MCDRTWLNASLFLCFVRQLAQIEIERHTSNAPKDAVVRGERAFGAWPGQAASTIPDRLPGPRIEPPADMEGRREELAAILRARAFPAAAEART